MQPPPRASEPRFPDLIDVQYTVKAAYKNPLGADTDGDYVLPLELPITTPPAQIPKIVSAGIALSPYVTRNNYSETEPRRRYCGRVRRARARSEGHVFRARAEQRSDQLLSNNGPELLGHPDEPALPIDPELIRVITFNQSNDDAGSMPCSRWRCRTARRRMRIASICCRYPRLASRVAGDVRFLHLRGPGRSLPLHRRFGPARQGAGGVDHRPGTLRPRPPRARHPASGTHADLHRRSRPEEDLRDRPYAVAVHNGKNVTADPPRTEIWALLYAQVKQRTTSNSATSFSTISSFPRTCG